MSTARNPVRCAKPTKDEAVKALREHLDDAEAETLARRYVNSDKDADSAVDWPKAKRRILHNKPKPRN